MDIMQSFEDIDYPLYHNKLRAIFFENLSGCLQDFGWSKELLNEVELQCNLPPNYHYVLFSGGMDEVISQFETWQDQKMLAMLELEKPKDKIREKIAQALETRIISAVPKSIIKQQNSFFSKPKNFTIGMSCYTNSCDLIWRYAGDKSTDFNYYTKRGLLLFVYTSARVFYIHDTSTDSRKTREFIEKSLDKVIKIQKIKAKLPAIDQIPIIRMFCN